jgi:heme A synthase
VSAALARAVVVALHLVNTLLLTASAALTVASARSTAPLRSAGAGTRAAPEVWALAALLVALAMVAASGAVTALGDTLFPVPERGGVQHSPEHFLVQLRVVHPILACVTGFAAVALARHLLGSAAAPSSARPWAAALAALTALQLGLGAANIWLHAPGWLQLTHLLLAQLLWISAVLLLRAIAVFSPAAVSPAAVSPAAVSPAAVSPAAVSPTTGLPPAAPSGASRAS